MPNPDGPLTALRAWIISPNLRLVTELRALLAIQSPGSSTVELTGYADDVELGRQFSAKPPSFCLLDVSSDRDAALRTLGRLLALDANLGIIAVLADNQPDYILHCLRQGAVDFLVPPYTAEHLAAAFAKMARLHGSEAALQKEPAKIFAVVPAKGACGASTIASNLAYQVKRLGAKKILLADLDPMAGTLSFLLKVKSNYSFMDVLLRRDGLDADLWKAMVTSANGVDVLLSPEMMVEGVNEITDAAPILDFARRYYDVVIVDAGGTYGEWNLSIARFANEMLLVTTNELPALQAAQRALSYLDSNRIGRWKIKLVVNRYDKEVGLNKDVIGQALHAEVFRLIPSDYEGVQRALMEGKPIAASSTFGRAVAQLAEGLMGQSPKEKKSSSFGGLFGGLFSRTSS
jgi:pilus assembly protein CpaE